MKEITHGLNHDFIFHCSHKKGSVFRVCTMIYNSDDFIGFPINHPPKTTEAAVPQQPRKERNEAIFQQQCCRHPGQTGAVGPIGKNPPEID